MPAIISQGFFFSFLLVLCWSQVSSFLIQNICSSRCAEDYCSANFKTSFPPNLRGCYVYPPHPAALDFGLSHLNCFSRWDVNIYERRLEMCLCIWACSLELLPFSMRRTCYRYCYSKKDERRGAGLDQACS